MTRLKSILTLSAALIGVATASAQDATTLQRRAQAEWNRCEVKYKPLPITYMIEATRCTNAAQEILRPTWRYPDLLTLKQKESLRIAERIQNGSMSNATGVAEVARLEVWINSEIMRRNATQVVAPPPNIVIEQPPAPSQPAPRNCFYNGANLGSGIIAGTTTCF